MIQQHEFDFTPNVVEELKKCGWYPGRNVSQSINLPPEFELFPDAQRILGEFCYLKCGEKGPGEECAKSTIELDPMLAYGEYDRFEKFEKILNRKLYPLGEAENRYYFLAVDDTGRIFLVMDDLLFVDISFDKALNRFFRGLKKKIVDSDGSW